MRMFQGSKWRLALNNTKIAFLSETIAFGIPLLLGLFWPLYSGPDSPISMGLRVGLLALTSILWVLWYRAAFTRAELKLIAILLLVCTLALVSALCAADYGRALKDWVKLDITCMLALGLMRPLRHGGTAKAFGTAMLIASLIPAIYILFIYVRSVGLTVPTYPELRIFKGRMLEHENVALNPIAFTACFSFAVGICLVRLRPRVWIIGLFVFIVAATLAGSRAPLAVVLGSTILLAGIEMARSRTIHLRSIFWMTAFLAIGTLGVLLAHADARSISSLTEGRSDLWKVAWTKFQEKPLAGYGFESWQDDLVSRVPRESEITRNLVRLKAGGYHNEYLTLLAEQGLLGFIPAIARFTALLVWCWRLAGSTSIAGKSGLACLFTCLLLLLRAGIEVPGLFGYGDGPPDYLAYCFVAVVVSRVSNEEDWRRSLTCSGQEV